MKTHRDFSTRAFTLIELLVVIVIITILTALAASQIIKALDKANDTKTQALVLELKTGLNSYFVEYNRFPIDPGAGGAEDAPEFLTDGSNHLVDALLGLPPASDGQDFNPKRIPYVEFSTAKNDRHGLAGTTRPWKLHDMWGQPLRVLLDTRGDNQLKNPDATNSDLKLSQNAATFLPVRIAIYSSGKDRKPKTADDIVSWRSK